MNSEQDKWLDEILHSAQNKAVVSPNPALFERINEQLEKKPKEEVTLVANWTKNWIAVAALIIGLLNAFAFQQLLSENYSTDATARQANYESLISDYNLYE